MNFVRMSASVSAFLFMRSHSRCLLHCAGRIFDEMIAGVKSRVPRSSQRRHTEICWTAAPDAHGLG